MQAAVAAPSMQDVTRTAADEIISLLDVLLKGQGRIEERLDELRSHRCSAVDLHLPSKGNCGDDGGGQEHQVMSEDQLPVTPAVAHVASSGGWSLPPDWPRCLAVHAFKTPSRATLFTADDILARLNDMESVAMESDVPSAAAEAAIPTKFGVCALHPYGKARVLWDQASCAVLSYDMVTLPVILAWDVPVTGVLSQIALAIFIFWILDLLLNFFTGVCRDGVISLDMRKAVIGYLRGWFFVDFVILVCNALSLFYDQSGADGTNTTGVALLRFAKAIRILRIASIMRVLRINETLKKLADNYANTQLVSLVEIPFLVLIMVLVSHLFACLWWAISTYSVSDTGRAWSRSNLPGLHYAYADSETPLLHQYTKGPSDRTARAVPPSSRGGGRRALIGSHGGRSHAGCGGACSADVRCGQGRRRG